MNRDQGYLWNNFAASSKQGCEQQQMSVLLMTGSGWVLKALLNFQQLVGIEEYFCNINKLF